MTKSHAADLLIELGCEELPPRALPSLAESFFAGVTAGLEKAGIGLSVAESRPLYTPRRMALHLVQVAQRQADDVQERRGPAVTAAFDSSGAPTQAARGFAHSVGRKVDDLETIETDKGERLFCRVEIPGKPLAEVLFPVLKEALDRLPVPRPMRWSDHDYRFVRPVHWLLVVYDRHVLEGELFGCPAARTTRGHRIHAPGPHEVPDPGSYLEVLRTACVEPDPDARAARIREQAEAAGAEAGGQTRITPELLEEVCNLVEWPVAVVCRFDEEFLDVPPEALVASMETQQKFFPVFEPDGQRLSPSFVVIANLESIDPDVMRAGYERVVRPRLADARFFWERDLKVALPDRLEALDGIVFQRKLGTVGDKSRRISGFAEELDESLGHSDALAQRAALLSKCDLVTLMVGEFPELQGTMGAYYARAAGEPDAVADAIGSHYRPRFAGDDIPPDETGRLVAIADRMDSLVGGFAAGLKPSGNKDPFALRRAALGVIRILLEGEYGWSLDDLLDMATRHLAPQIAVTPEIRTDVRRFILERLRHHLKEQGVSSNQIQAVLAAPLGSLPDLKARLDALRDFMRRPEAESLIVANKRIGNILRDQQHEISEEIDPDHFTIDEERRLFEEVERISPLVEGAFEEADYSTALATLAELRGSVDRYFDHVMVMDEDAQLRGNRLTQLSQLKSLFDRVADFSVAD